MYKNEPQNTESGQDLDAAFYRIADMEMERLLSLGLLNNRFSIRAFAVAMIRTGFMIKLNSMKDKFTITDFYYAMSIMTTPKTYKVAGLPDYTPASIQEELEYLSRMTCHSEEDLGRLLELKQLLNAQ